MPDSNSRTFKRTETRQTAVCSQDREQELQLWVETLVPVHEFTSSKPAIRRAVEGKCTLMKSFSWASKFVSPRLLMERVTTFVRTTTVFRSDEKAGTHTFAVASSKTNTPGWFTIALAMQSSCLCPALQFAPRSLTLVASPSGRSTTASLRPTISMISQIRASEHWWSCFMGGRGLGGEMRETKKKGETIVDPVENTRKGLFATQRVCVATARGRTGRREREMALVNHCRARRPRKRLLY